MLLSVGLSLLLFEGEIVGTREGTILTALLTGFAVKWFVARLEGPLNARLRGKAIPPREEAA